MKTWDWPLLDIKWIPEILTYIDSIHSATWEIIKRELTIFSPNKKLSKFLILQLKSFLKEFELTGEKGGIVYLNVPAAKESIITFLHNTYINSNEMWAVVFRELHESKQFIEYNKESSLNNKKAEFLTSLSIFRQWGCFFEFINLAFLVDNKLFPVSSITEEMLNDTNFIDRLVKRRFDPRSLLLNNSKHQKADTLLFTKGETKVLITNDSDIYPRIDPFALKTTDPAIHPDLFVKAMDNSIQEYQQYIRTLYGPFIQKEVGSYIYSAKILFDYFAWGKENIICDEIDSINIKRLKNIWDDFLKVRFPHSFWTAFPKVYNSVTHLYWNQIFFSNYLNRPSISLYFDEELIGHEYFNAKLPIRCRHSRISLLKIMQVVWLIYKKSNLPETLTKVQRLRSEIIEMHELDSSYLPQDAIDRKIILDKISEYIFISDSDKVLLLEGNEALPIFITNPLLEKFATINEFYNMKATRHIAALLRLKEKVDKFESRLAGEIQSLEKALDKQTLHSLNHRINILREILKVDQES